MPHMLVFDIGKTNKKCFIFDKNFQEVYNSYERFEEVKDEDGFPCDDLNAISSWVQSTLETLINEGYDIEAINFSTYGASFVHLDAAGLPVTPLYNYLKPFPEKLLEQFYRKYGASPAIARQTASPQLGMLNSGMQLYWLKYTRPDVFKKIRWSLHFPQYLSFLLTGIPLSEFTSIGCHTGLWNFQKKDYHDWVYAEGIDRVLPPVVTSDTSINTRVSGKKLKVGVGIHDSSSALLPYLKADKKPFLLISTGTWSISLNPFSTDPLSDEELLYDCLNFMRVNGRPTKAARLFLGNEYSLQVKKLQEYFQVPEDAHKMVLLEESIFSVLRTKSEKYFHFSSIALPRKQPERNRLEHFATFEEAYHQLMWELVDMQAAAAKRAIGNTMIKKLYVDGGFADNDLFVKMLSFHFPDVKVRTTKSPLGSALGAAMVITDKKVKRKFLKKHYAMKKVRVESMDSIREEGSPKDL